jgi:hypothetical protein
MTRRDVGILMAVAILIIAGVTIVRTTSHSSHNDDPKPADSLMSPAPGYTERSKAKRTLYLDEFPLGISQTETKTILDETAYSLDSERFGRINKEIGSYTVYGLMFNEVEGVLRLAFDEKTNKSTGGYWLAEGSTTKSDFRNLVEIISGHPYKGDHFYDFLGAGMVYTWETNSTAFSLIWNKQSLGVFLSKKKGKKEKIIEDEAKDFVPVDTTTD